MQELQDSKARVLRCSHLPRLSCQFLYQGRKDNLSVQIQMQVGVLQIFKAGTGKNMKPSKFDQVPEMNLVRNRLQSATGCYNALHSKAHIPCFPMQNNIHFNAHISFHAIQQGAEVGKRLVFHKGSNL